MPKTCAVSAASVVGAVVDLQPGPGDLRDPLRAYEPLPFSIRCSPLGFSIEFESNNASLLGLVECSWPPTESSLTSTNIRLQIGVHPCKRTACPPAPILRAQGHLLTMVCDRESFITCDLRSGYAFGWISSSLLEHREFLRYHLLDAAIMTLLSSTHLTPLHAACVSKNGRGVLLHGRSAAGKSTLAYACARVGWTYTTDDASYLLRDGALRVRGRCGQIRFRPSARELFPELESHSITPRMQGKPSIEIATETLPFIATAAETQVDALIELDRGPTRDTCLTLLSPRDAMPLLEESLFPVPFVRERQRSTLQNLLGTKMFALHYRDCESAIEALDKLVKEQIG